MQNDLGTLEAKADLRATKEKWLLVGGVASGKTYFLYAALTNPAIETGVANAQTGIANFDFIADAGSRSKLEVQIKEVALNGVTNATFQLCEYEFKVKIANRADAVAQTAAARPAMTISTVTLIDGPGGAIVPSGLWHAAQPTDLAPIAERYARELLEADALMVFLPVLLPGEEYNVHEFQNLLAILDRAASGEFKKLRRIALCITKYEALFFDDGANASAAALEPERLKAAFAAVDPKGNLAERLQDATPERGGSIEVCVFPVSAYGFIGETGFCNLERVSRMPLVSPIEPRVSVTSIHGVDLYPRAFTRNEWNVLWRPFNLAAPLVFLASGQTDGLLHLKASEFGRLDFPSNSHTT